MVIDAIFFKFVLFFKLASKKISKQKIRAIHAARENVKNNAEDKIIIAGNTNFDSLWTYKIARRKIAITRYPAKMFG